MADLDIIRTFIEIVQVASVDVRCRVFSFTGQESPVHFISNA